MRFGSVCSGIEAASVAWGPLNWKAAWFSEIEPFPSATLNHHYPDVPNYGDMTALPARILSGEVEAPDVFCGGTPCQAFSVAGNRKSLDDARGNLSLTFCEIANAIDTIRQQRNQSPTIIFWENVPGVLNTKDNAFGCFLAEIAGETVPLQPSGGRWTDAGFVSGPKRTIAWRVLDAQYFGLAQRRRRVFVVASSRKGFNPSEVLFEFDSARRDTAPSRKAGQGITADAETGFKLHETVGTLCADTHPGSYSGQDAYTGRLIPVCAEPYQPVVGALCARDYKGVGNQYVGEDKVVVCAEISPTVTYGIQGNMIGRADTAGPQGKGFSEEVGYTLTKTDVHGVVSIQDVREVNKSQNGKGWRDDGVAYTVDTFATQGVATQVAVPTYSIRPDVTPKFYEDIAETIGATDYKDPTCVSTQYALRRLTPVECERLQGFPDNYTNIPWRNKPEAPDGPRYKALGNSWAVPVVRWIGERINNAVN